MSSIAWSIRGFLGLHYPLWNRHCPNKGLYSYSPLGAYSCHFFLVPWACWPCWPIGPITSFLGLSQPTYFIFISYSPMGLLTVIPVMLAHWACYLFIGLPRPACFIFTSYPSHGPAGCHSCHSNPLSLLPLFLDFLDPVTSSLLLILPIGLLVVISAMLAIGFTNLLLPFLFLFHSISLIVGLLLLLDLS